MSSPGAGIGGVGAPLQREHSEMETTAAVQMVKAGLGIVPNTLDIPLTKLGGNVWQYKSAEGKPLLPMFVSVTVARMDDPIDNSWQDHYKALVGQLPDRLRTLLNRESGKPLSERLPAFITLDNTLQFMGVLSAWLERAEKMRLAERPPKKAQFTYRFTKDLLQAVDELFQAIRKEVAPLPPTHPIRIATEPFLTPMQRLLGDMIVYFPSIDKDGEPLTKKQELDLERMTLNLKALYILLETNREHLPVRLLEPLIKTFGLLLDNVKERASVGLFAFGVSLVGKEFIGKTLQELLKSPLPHTPLWLATTLEKLSLLTLLGGIAFATETEVFDKRVIASLSEMAHTLSREMAFRLGALIFLEAELLPQTIQTLFSFMGINEETTNHVIAIQETALIIALLLTGESAKEPLFLMFKPRLKHHLATLKQDSVPLHQADLALQKDDWDGFLDGWARFIQPLTVDALQTDLRLLLSFITSIRTARATAKEQSRSSQVLMNQSA